MARRRQKDREREEFLCQAVRERATKYLTIPGVTSVGVGRRLVRNDKTGEEEETDELCIQFTVEKKLSPDVLAAEQITPLPESMAYDDDDSIPVQILQRSYGINVKIVSEPEAAPEARAQRRSRVDPVMPGVSVSHEDGTAGTVGAIVFDKRSGDPMVLSNWHVLHGPSGNLGDNIVQPGPFDDPQANRNSMGSLVRSHLGIAGDMAVASMQRGFDRSILETEATPTRVGRVELGDRVIKSGRTTGVTRGVVSRVGVVTQINYGGNVGRQSVGGFEIKPIRFGDEISSGGDSGSVWMLDEDGNEDVGVGLHFAGETSPDPNAEFALACNLDTALDRMEVSINPPTIRRRREFDPDLIDTILQLLAELQRRVGRFEALDEGSGHQCTCGNSSGIDEAVAGTEGIGLPVYGNWCGPGYGGSGSPVDDVDRACMIHDNCYGAKGYFNCSCDQELVTSLERAINSGGVSFRGRLMGRIIRRWFQLQPCRD